MAVQFQAYQGLVSSSSYSKVSPQIAKNKKLKQLRCLGNVFF